MKRPAAALAMLALASAAAAQPLDPSSSSQSRTFDGYASVFLDRVAGATELRTRVVADYRRSLGDRLRLTIAGFAEGLVALRRAGLEGLEPGKEVVRAAIVRPQDVHLDARWEHADLRVGFSRVVWGRLDEFLPTDVVNPQDVTRFFFEGRSEGRMPVGMVRGRWLPSDAFALEAIYVPLFRRGRFDQLDEETAPFNLAPPVPIVYFEPVRTPGSAQGGVRASATTGRVDWSVSAYRGFEPLPVLLPATPAFAPAALIARFPRFTMIGGDVETVRGQWGLRGEIAAFAGRDAVESGIGIDRRAGSYRVSGTAMFSHQAARSDFTLVTSVDRAFARETRSIRAFAVYNPREQSAFARVIASASLRDNVSLEGSGGWFTGGPGSPGSAERGTVDLLARFSDRDFLYLRLKVFF